MGDGEARQRFVLVRNPQEEARDRARREEILKALEEELEGLARLDKGEHPKAVWPEINRAKVREEERLDGKYLLQTSDDTLSPADVALRYKQLLEVEKSFRTLKQTLDLRPVYHRLSQRIRAHVLLCWLALLLIRVAEVQTEEKLGQRHTWPRLRDELSRMHLGFFAGPAGTVWQRTETTTSQRQILSALGVQEPPRFFKLAPHQAV